MSRLSYTYSCLVPFHLADPAGIVFFGNVFTLMHQAFEHFVIHTLDCSWNQWFQNSEWIVPIRHAQADYHLPIHAGKPCTIELFVHSISTSSFTLESYIKQEGEICCSIKTIHVFCNRTTKKKIAIPENFSTLLLEKI